MSTNVCISETYFSAFFREISPLRLLKMRATIVMAIMRITHTTPPIIATVLLEELLPVEPSLAVPSTLGYQGLWL